MKEEKLIVPLSDQKRTEIIEALMNGREVVFDGLGRLSAKKTKPRVGYSIIEEKMVEMDSYYRFKFTPYHPVKQLFTKLARLS